MTRYWIPNWKGGRYHHDGYVKVLQKGHPFADAHGYVSEHRLIVEKHLNAILLPWGDVHHKNEIRDDNRLENLGHGMHREHMRHHAIKTGLSGKNNRIDMSDRRCKICKTKTTWISKEGWTTWHSHPITKEKWICIKCYNKIYRNRHKNV